jgi:hypothetical protein
MEQDNPSEALKGFHGQLVKYISIDHSLEKLVKRVSASHALLKLVKHIFVVHVELNFLETVLAQILHRYVKRETQNIHWKLM